MDKPHKRLRAWKLAMELADQIYKISKAFPPEEKHGLTAQIRKSCVSVPSNIAEGAARSSYPDFRRFLSIARGSLSELDTQLDLCVRWGYLSSEQRNELDQLLIEIDKTIYALRESLGSRACGPRPASE